jgi:hypothetical protein
MQRCSLSLCREGLPVLSLCFSLKVAPTCITIDKFAVARLMPVSCPAEKELFSILCLSDAPRPMGNGLQSSRTAVWRLVASPGSH